MRGIWQKYVPLVFWAIWCREGMTPLQAQTREDWSNVESRVGLKEWMSGACFALSSSLDASWIRCEGIEYTDWTTRCITCDLGGEGESWGVCKLKANVLPLEGEGCCRQIFTKREGLMFLHLGGQFICEKQIIQACTDLKKIIGQWVNNYCKRIDHLTLSRVVSRKLKLR